VLARQVTFGVGDRRALVERSNVWSLGKPTLNAAGPKRVAAALCPAHPFRRMADSADEIVVEKPNERPRRNVARQISLNGSLQDASSGISDV
jgi:hypothetical protein